MTPILGATFVVEPMSPTDEVADWATRPVTDISDRGANALTVDVEDYFQVEAFSEIIVRGDWDRQECRVERNVDRILEMFANARVHGTFFTLAWVAERYPHMVRRIVANGHEIASHGLMHHRADQQSQDVFLSDVIRAKSILEDTAGVSVKGYRAASFSITRRNPWALGALARAGYGYSSSLYPIRHDLYGIPDAPRFAFYPLPHCSFIEIPVTAVRRFGVNWPCGGGGYFRLLPYVFSAHNMRFVRKHDKQPCMFYFHPWEIDPGQPRIAGVSRKARFRHYINIEKMQGRLERLLREFTWKRVDQIYPVSDRET
jgi:polysaccharide deacetylase family protein (PEP-CTERM system associated)